jgi:hypothetical protein
LAQAGFKKGKNGATPADLLVQLGPTLLVDIGLKSRSPPGEPPDLPRKAVRALIDTGAGGVGIDDDLARSRLLRSPRRGPGPQRKWIGMASLELRNFRLVLFCCVEHRGEFIQNR